MSHIDTLTEESKQHLIDRIGNSVTVNQKTGCWEWNLYCNHKNGYGQFCLATVDGKSIWGNAHRVSYELFNGPVPEGLEVAHVCHCAGCVNPTHLIACTHRDNIRMSAAAGRTLRGEDKPAAKLTEKDVRQIRSGKFSHMMQVEIADQFDVHPVTISEVINGKTWKHVTV